MRPADRPSPSRLRAQDAAQRAAPGEWSGIVTDKASGTGRRYLALWLPFLPTDRCQRSPRGPGDETPFVMVETVKSAMRIAAISPFARKLGLAPGLTLADARARIPDLCV